MVSSWERVTLITQILWKYEWPSFDVYDAFGDEQTNCSHWGNIYLIDSVAKKWLWSDHYRIYDEIEIDNDLAWEGYDGLPANELNFLATMDGELKALRVYSLETVEDDWILVGTSAPDKAPVLDLHELYFCSKLSNSVR